MYIWSMLFSTLAYNSINRYNLYLLYCKLLCVIIDLKFYNNHNNNTKMMILLKIVSEVQLFIILFSNHVLFFFLLLYYHYSLSVRCAEFTMSEKCVNFEYLHNIIFILSIMWFTGI